MNIVSTRLVLMLCALSPVLLVTGCPDAVYCSYGVCHGYYYDSLVSGLTYESRNAEGVTHTGVTGEGDDPGRFSYAEGDTVSFSLGGLDLGQSIGEVIVTPFDIAGIEEDAIGGCAVDGELPADTDVFRKVINLAVLLQTLDTDGDAAAGIEISPEVAAMFEDASIDLNQASTAFREDAALQAALEAANDDNLFPEVRSLVEREVALRALYRGIGLCDPDS
jgi:para-nitrobenzyl esterase